jgi:hypothetical protein
MWLMSLLRNSIEICLVAMVGDLETRLTPDKFTTYKWCFLPVVDRIEETNLLGDCFFLFQLQT